MNNQKDQSDKLALYKLVKDKFLNYRKSGIAFTVTIISLSSALIIWANNLRISKNPISKCSLNLKL